MSLRATHNFIKCSTIEEYLSHNGLDTFDASSVDTWDSYFIWGHLYFSSIANSTVFVGQELRFGRALVAKLDKDYFIVSFHGEVAGAFIVRGGILPFQVNARNIFSPPIF